MGFWASGASSADQNTHGIVGRGVWTDGTTFRQVFPNTSDVFAAWAKQETPCGRNGWGRVYFYGRTVYSYRDSWPLMHILPFEYEGKRVALVNTTKYSSSTSGHLRSAQSAFSGVEVETTRDMMYAWVTYEKTGLDWSRIRSNDDLERWKREQTHILELRVLIVNDEITSLVNRVDELCNVRKRAWLGHDVADNCENRCASLDDSRIKRVADILQVSLLDCTRYDLDGLRGRVRAAYAAFNDPKAVKRRKAGRRRRSLTLLHNQIKRYRKWSGWRAGQIDAEIIKLAFDYSPHQARQQMQRFQAWLLGREIDALFERAQPGAGDAAYNIRYRKSEWSPHHRVRWHQPYWQLLNEWNALEHDEKYFNRRLLPVIVEA
jgi:hypothetical protein